jgi:hypothetical protein
MQSWFMSCETLSITDCAVVVESIFAIRDVLWMWSGKFGFGTYKFIATPALDEAEAELFRFLQNLFIVQSIGKGKGKALPLQA